MLCASETVLFGNSAGVRREFWPTSDNKNDDFSSIECRMQTCLHIYLVQVFASASSSWSPNGQREMLL